MLPGLALGEMVALLERVGSLVRAGLVISGLGYLSFSLLGWLSGWTRIPRPDPTAFVRLWEVVYDQLLHPFGTRAVSPDLPDHVNRARYELVVGLVVTGALLGLYVLFSGLVLGSVLASAVPPGTEPDLSSLFQAVAASCLLIFLAAISHACERSSRSI